MSNWLILLQTESEKPANITKWLKELGQQYQIIQLWKEKIPEPVERFKGLILMGGVMSANDEEHYPFLAEEINLIRDWARRSKPMLGICLGAQLIARAMGESVYQGEKPEIGWFPVQLTEEGRADPIFQGLPAELTVFQWHYDTFDLPESGILLASSNLFPNQAFRVGDHIYASQFHPEMDEDLIRSWVTIHQAKLRQLNPDLPQKILTETKIYLNGLEKLGRHLLAFLCKKIS